MLEKQADNLWTISTDFRLLGFNIGTRMTIIRLPWGGLFLHSPILLSPEVERILGELGEVQYVIAPNSYHHMFVRPYLERYPNSQFWTVPEVTKKRPKLPNPKFLTEAGFRFIGDEILLEIVEGSRHFSEAVFLHVPTKTLILTDLIFNHPRQESLWQRIHAKILDVGPPPGPSRIARYLIGRGSHTQVSLHKIMKFDFERIIVPHGDVINKNAKQILFDGFKYLF